MNYTISPKYQMSLIKQVAEAIWAEYRTYKEVRFYINKWHSVEDEGYGNQWENFNIASKENGEIDLIATLHNIGGDTLLKIAIDLGVDTPDFIPSIATFRNEIKSDYKTACTTFEKAFKQIEANPDTAIGLANSALESIIKEILKDERIKSKIKGSETLYALTSAILKEFQLLSESEIPKEIKTIGNSLLTACQSIEKLRSEKTDFHGKTDNDYVIKDSLFTYFIVNSVTTIGLFLNSFYKLKYTKQTDNIDLDNELPF